MRLYTTIFDGITYIFTLRACWCYANKLFLLLINHRNTMKFTKEQVLENIKTKLGNSQKITDRTILESVEPLLGFASEETELDDFVSKIYPSIDSTNRNLIKEQSDFVKNYKPADLKPIETPQALTADDIRKLIAEEREAAIKPLQEKIDAIEFSKKRDSIFKSVQNKLKEDAKTAFREKAAKKAWDYTIRGISDDLSEDELYATYKSKYEEECSDLDMNPYEPKGGTGNGDANNFSAEIARLQTEGKLPKQTT